MGNADCHTSVRTGFAMTHYKECGVSPDGRTEASAPTECLPIEFRRGRRPRRPAPVIRGAVRGRNPPVTASPCQPPLGKGAEGTGDADCHSQCAHWLRNDTVNKKRGGAAGHMGPALQPHILQGRARVPCRECGAESAGGQRRPPLRKRNKRCNGRATARVAPTEGLQGVRCGEESPSHGFAVPAPFRQGGRGDGGCGLPQPVCALASQ